MTEVPDYLRPFVLSPPAHAAGAGVRVEIIDVPHGRHSFDIADHTDESRAAVRRAVEWVRDRQA